MFIAIQQPLSYIAFAISYSWTLKKHLKCTITHFSYIKFSCFVTFLFYRANLSYLFCLSFVFVSLFDFIVQVILSQFPEHPFGMVVYGNFLYWTDWTLRAVLRVNKWDGSGLKEIRKNIGRQPMSIVAVAEDADDCMLSPSALLLSVPYIEL